MKPGQIIVWTQINRDGSTEEKIGEVWNAAPLSAGVDPYWVIDADTDRPVAVAKSGKRGVTRGAAWMSGMSWRVTVPAGDFYSEVDPFSPTGSLTEAARPTPYALAA